MLCAGPGGQPETPPPPRGSTALALAPVAVLPSQGAPGHSGSRPDTSSLGACSPRGGTVQGCSGQTPPGTKFVLHVAALYGARGRAICGTW